MLSTIAQGRTQLAQELMAGHELMNHELREAFSPENVQDLVDSYASPAPQINWQARLQQTADRARGFRQSRLAIAQGAKEEAFNLAWEYTWAFYDQSVLTVDFPNFFYDLKELVTNFDINKEETTFSLLIKSVEEILFERAEKDEEESK
ncbi:MAG: hypothetical protein F6K58_04090 [Symploca sp. SIO2E9]|nr:hypothetical protein [Symploca sp. SIO2E9]